MPKRRKFDAENRPFDRDDDPIDLTGAFAPAKGPQSVDYDSDDDPMGLTQAFGAVTPDEDEHSWSEADKWKGFDWGNSKEKGNDEDESAGAAPQGEDAEDAAIDAMNEDVEDFLDDEDAVIDEEEAPAAAKKAARRSKRERERLQEDAFADKSVKPAGAKGAKGSQRGRHAAPAPELSPRMKKSQRTRRILIALVILLVVVLGALCFYMYRTFSSSQQEAVQQTQEQTAAPREESIIESTGDAVDTTPTRLADVPNLAQLIGMTQDEAIAAIGRGGMVTANREINEEGNPVKVSLSVALTEEAADSKTGTPTVYLDLGEDGRVRQAGYSASASALGFGSLSFADAVASEHVVEKTLAKTGIEVPEGAAVLPTNKDEYTAYGSDGTTVVREQCSFEGETSVNGIPCVWSSILSYDYTTQVITGNLTDTVRVIYVYVSMK